MVMISNQQTPPEYAELWAKILRWFEVKGVPRWCAQYFQNTRTKKAERVAKSPIVHSHPYWTAMSAIDQQNWRNAAFAAEGFYRGYRLFTSDFIYRRENALSLPGTPSNFHSLFGLVIDNPAGASNVELRRDDKDLIGPITCQISFAKDERTPSGTYGLTIAQTAYYFWSGKNVTVTNLYSAPAGNIAWNTQTLTFGVAGAKYFHYKFVLSIQNYDAQVKVDNIIFSDANGVFYRENFNIKRYAVWKPNYLYRKRDWFFTPSFSAPNFIHQYLD